MEIALSEEQSLLRSSLRETLSREVTFDRIRQLELAGASDGQLWAKLAELGWLSLPFPEETGGGGGSLVDLALVTEEVARTAALVPFAEVMAAGMTLSRFGGGRFDDLLTELQQGSQVILPAVLDEQDSYQSMQPGENGKPFDGVRYFVDYAPAATAFLVRTADGLDLVPDVTSARLEPLVSISRTPIANVQFAGAATTQVSGNDGWSYLHRLMRVLTAVQCLAYGQVAADMATEYVKNRVQFGRPLGSFQAVQHHCANMALMNQGARFMVYEAAWALDQGVATDEQIDMAKAWAARSAVEVTALSHQLHGGIGVTEEYDLHFFSRRAKERAVAWGTPEECLDRVGESIGKPVDWS